MCKNFSGLTAVFLLLFISVSMGACSKNSKQNAQETSGVPEVQEAQNVPPLVTYEVVGEGTFVHDMFMGFVEEQIVDDNGGVLIKNPPQEVISAINDYLISSDNDEGDWYRIEVIRSGDEWDTSTKSYKYDYYDVLVKFDNGKKSFQSITYQIKPKEEM